MAEGDRFQALKKALLPAGAIAAIILAIGLLLYALAIPLDLLIIQRIYAHVSDKIVSITGISQWLAKGIVIIALIPFIWIIPNFIRGKYKRQARAAALLYFGIFFLSIFFLSKDIYFHHSGEERVLKWYALTPDGVKFYDSPGVDPVYGTVLRPVTPEVIKDLKKLQKGDISPIDPKSVKFFNPITGEAQVWYYKYPDGEYEFYDKPIFHPITGEKLKPVTRQVFDDWKEKESERDKKREELRQQKAEEDRARQEELAKIEAENAERRRQEEEERQREQAVMAEKRRQAEVMNRPPTNQIKLLDNAPVKALNFFESGRNVPREPSQFVYRTRFDRAATRFVNWDMQVDSFFNLFKQKQSFEVRTIWYKPDGSIFAEDNTVFSYDPSRLGGSHYINGRGWDEPGHYELGVYHVDFYVLEEKVASGSFEVY